MTAIITIPRSFPGMTGGQEHTAPLPTVRRLPHYLRLLQDLQAMGEATVSCTRMSDVLKCDATQIRKDLAVTGVTGKPKVGYQVSALIDAIKEFLGWNNVSDAFLIGVGSLGRALLGYERLRERNGLNICAAFDTDPAKIGTQVRGCEVLALAKLPNLAERLHVRIGVVAVPMAAAQGVADLLVSSGIRAIWNFSPTSLAVPPPVILEQVDLSISLAVLSSRLASRIKHEDQAQQEACEQQPCQH